MTQTQTVEQQTAKRLADLLSAFAKEKDAEAVRTKDVEWLSGYYEGKAAAFRLAAQWIKDDFL